MFVKFSLSHCSLSSSAGDSVDGVPVNRADTTPGETLIQRICEVLLRRACLLASALSKALPDSFDTLDFLHGRFEVRKSSLHTADFVMQPSFGVF
jgi:hypothetical protein